MAWFILFIAGICETAWAVGLKYTQGFTRLYPTLWVIITMLLSVFLLAKAVQQLPVGTAYAVWTGIGASLTAILGIILFGESWNLGRLVCIGLIILGIAGLKYFSVE